MTIKHYLQFSDLTLSEYEYLIERARIIKQKFKNYEPYHPLLDRTLVMVFEKSSTRTRLSFEAGMHQLGGTAIYLNTRDSQLGRERSRSRTPHKSCRACPTSSSFELSAMTSWNEFAAYFARSRSSTA